MDIFILLCFCSVFLSLLEFALINFIDTMVMLRKRREKEKEEKARLRTEKAKVRFSC